jgi:hypothetical protein
MGSMATSVVLLAASAFTAQQIKSSIWQSALRNLLNVSHVQLIGFVLIGTVPAQKRQSSP